MKFEITYEGGVVYATDSLSAVLTVLENLESHYPDREYSLVNTADMKFTTAGDVMRWSECS